MQGIGAVAAFPKAEVRLRTRRTNRARRCLPAIHPSTAQPQRLQPFSFFVDFGCGTNRAMPWPCWLFKIRVHRCSLCLSTHFCETNPSTIFISYATTVSCAFFQFPAFQNEPIPGFSMSATEAQRRRKPVLRSPISDFHHGLSGQIRLNPTIQFSSHAFPTPSSAAYPPSSAAHHVSLLSFGLPPVLRSGTAEGGLSHLSLFLKACPNPP